MYEVLLYSLTSQGDKESCGIIKANKFPEAKLLGVAACLVWWMKHYIQQADIDSKLQMEGESGSYHKESLESLASLDTDLLDNIAKHRWKTELVKRRVNDPHK